MSLDPNESGPVHPDGHWYCAQCDDGTFITEFDDCEECGTELEDMACDCDPGEWLEGQREIDGATAADAEADGD